MSNKQIIGLTIVTIGVSALIILYKGYYIPRQEVQNTPKDKLKQETKTTTGASTPTQTK